VDRVIGHAALAEVRSHLPHAIIVAAARTEVEAARSSMLGQKGGRSLEEIVASAARRAWEMVSPSLRPVINATGVIIHTNLGRAPLSAAAVEAMQRVAGYSNLEYDLEAGERGSRYTHAASILRQVTGCEDALVVNNNAAALVLALGTLAVGKEVVLSRGQSVEIGGGFRIPDVMRQSGAHLIEVGTTNRTYVRDYAEVIGDETALLLRVHASNFRIVGFTTSPMVEELAALAHERGLLMLDDIGSGALLDTTRYGLAPEPTVQASLQGGADLVLCSGDKLLGGPQCGIIVGRKDVVARLRKHPLARALRVDKITLAGLEATLLHYLKDEVETHVPVWRMISMSEPQLRARAEGWTAQLRQARLKSETVQGRSTIGGGSLPGETLPTWLVSIHPRSEDAGHMAARLRSALVPVIARVEEGSLLLDPRTVLDGQDGLLLEEVTQAYSI
jgi:L-seryl-tRNA(Ser) seleniumtransferase